MSTARPGRPTPALHPTRQQLDELDALLKRMLDLPGGPAEIDERDLQIETSVPAVTSLPSTVSNKVEPELTKPISPALGPNPPARSSGPVIQKPHFLRQKINKPDENVGNSDSASEDWVPLRSSWQPSPHTWGPLAETWRQVQEGEAKPEAILRQDDPVGSTDNLKDQCQAAREPVEKKSSLPTVQPPRRYEPVGKIQPTEMKIHPHSPPINSPSSLVFKNPVQEPVQFKPVTPSPIPGPVPQTVSAPVESVRVVADLTQPGTLDHRFAVRPFLWLNQGFDVMVGWAGSPGRWLTSPSGHACLGYLGIGCLIGAIAVLTLDLLGWT